MSGVDFYWLMDEVAYALLEVRPEQFRQIVDHAQNRAVFGIPRIYAYIDGDVEWWPQCASGLPELRAHA